MSNVKLTPEDIKRVKGLGCLRDKRYEDVFNVRVLTVNGKISTEKQRAIADAADKFGSGEVAMTTRQTIEIQGVPYANLEGLFAFLRENGLESGGTGPKVRPVVSCKGTTCVFGLIDTYSLSEKIHTRFYQGWHGTALPHKFKIAVGGCPHNCVKPNLNDLGIIGCRTPDKSRGYCVYVGGRWGKKTAVAQPLDKIFSTEDEVLEVIERALTLFRDEGNAGERFSETIDRLGFDYVENRLIGNV